MRFKSALEWKQCLFNVDQWCSCTKTRISKLIRLFSLWKARLSELNFLEEHPSLGQER